MRVLHVAQPEHSGVPTVVAQLALAQVERGWEVAIACPSESVLRETVRHPQARLWRWEAARSPGPTTLAETVRVGQIVHSVDPDVVHLHSAKAGLAGRLAVRGSRATLFQPHAWSFEAAGPLLRPAAVAWERVGARWADRIVCVSEAERARGEEFGIGARFTCIRNGIDVQRYSPATERDAITARRTLGLRARPLAVYVGRMVRQKGIDVLLDAWGSLARRMPEAALVMVGDGPDRILLEKTQAVANVVWAGAREDVPRWLTAADVVVLPSRWEAGASLVAMEAMATCRSVVATDVAGMRDLVEPGAGEVVPVEDATSLARAVERRLRDPALARREGQVGRERVERGYSVERVNERFFGLYEEVLRERLAY